MRCEIKCVQCGNHIRWYNSTACEADCDAACPINGRVCATCARIALEAARENIIAGFKKLRHELVGKTYDFVEQIEEMKKEIVDVGAILDNMEPRD
jgi:hypothetical protein